MTERRMSMIIFIDIIVIDAALRKNNMYCSRRKNRTYSRPLGENDLSKVRIRYRSEVINYSASFAAS